MKTLAMLSALALFATTLAAAPGLMAALSDGTRISPAAHRPAALVRRMKRLACLIPLIAAAQAPPESYRVENVPLPRDVAPEVAAITFAQDGTLGACFRRGYIYVR
jgi:hypothetical protein